METSNLNESTDVQKQPVKEVPFMKRYAIGIKAILITILVMLLLIPAAMIMGLISEREHRQNEATEEVSSKWGGMQTITGPVIVIPYVVKPGETAVAMFLPDKL